MILFTSTFFELFTPFLMMFGVTSFVLIMQRISTLVTLMVEKLFSIGDVGLLLLYSIPTVFSLTISLSVVGAVFITVIRKSMDSEIISIQASGANLWKFSAPILAFGLLTTVCTLILSVWVQPIAHQKYAELQASIIKVNADAKLQPGQFNYQFGRKAVQIGARSSDNELSEIFIADRVQSGASSVILADKGRIAVDDDSKQVMFRLHNGTVYIPGDQPEVLRTIHFDQLSYRLNFVPKNVAISGTLNRKSTAALWREAHAFPPGVISYYRWMLQFHSRLALPWSCLVFSLAAIPMAIVEPRSGKSGSFLRAIFLVVGFYVIWTGFTDLVSGGKAPPEVLWLPVMLVGLYGLLRLWQVDSNVSLRSFFLNRLYQNAGA